MQLETERLIVREAELTDASGLLVLKNDPQVLKYAPDFLGRDADRRTVETRIAEWIRRRDTGDFSEEVCYAVCLRESGELIGAVTVSFAGYLRETQIGWMFRSEYCGQGYASEAGRAASDFLLERFGFEYLIVLMDVDNPASFRVAQKSGFRLFEKRVPFDYHYCDCAPESPEEVERYFARNQAQTGSCYYYFRKYSPCTESRERFYGDTVYDGRFA